MLTNKLNLISLILLTFLPCLFLKAQTYVTLSEEKLETKDFNYNVKEVIDGRINRFCIGLAQKGITNSRSIAFLKYGVEMASLV
jgi:uncharacterized Rmd1/YagE family protein